jgi:hypothetical protein
VFPVKRLTGRRLGAALAALATVLIASACAVGSSQGDNQAPYLVLRYPSGITSSEWLEEPRGQPQLIKNVPGDGSARVGLVTTPVGYGPNPVSQLTSLYTSASRARAGLSPTTGTSVDGQSTWYHVRLLLPKGEYAPTTGEWNWLVEWHDDLHTAPSGGGPLSTAMGIYTNFPAISGKIGQNPHLVLRLAGGNAAAPTYQSIRLGAPVRYDHWYDISFHFVWSVRPGTGLAEWYVDGRRIVSEHFPTLYTNRDGTHSYNEFGIFNYHWASPWSSTVDFDQTAIGPTRESVGG